MAHKMRTMPFRRESYRGDINDLTRRLTRIDPHAVVTPFTSDAFGYEETQLYLGYDNHRDEQALALAVEQVVRGLHAREQTFYKQPLPSPKQWDSVKKLTEPVSDLLRTAADGHFALIFGGLPIGHYQQLAEENRRPQQVLGIEAKRMYDQLKKKMPTNHRSINLLDPRVEEKYLRRHDPAKHARLRKYYTD